MTHVATCMYIGVGTRGMHGVHASPPTPSFLKCCTTQLIDYVSVRFKVAAIAHCSLDPRPHPSRVY